MMDFIGQFCNNCFSTSCLSDLSFYSSTCFVQDFVFICVILNVLYSQVYNCDRFEHYCVSKTEKTIIIQKQRFLTSVSREALTVVILDTVNTRASVHTWLQSTVIYVCFTHQTYTRTHIIEVNFLSIVEWKNKFQSINFKINNILVKRNLCNLLTKFDYSSLDSNTIFGDNMDENQRQKYLHLLLHPVLLFYELDQIIKKNVQNFNQFQVHKRRQLPWNKLPVQQGCQALYCPAALVCYT